MSDILNNEASEPVVTFSFLKYGHKEDIQRVTQIDDLHNMLLDLRRNIRQSLKHEAPFLGVPMTKDGLEILEKVSSWFQEAERDYGVTLDAP
jgi:hypothetical protein